MSASGQPRPIVLLRPVPGRSPIHDLWPGTKLVAVFGISVLLTFYPGWVTIGLMAAVVLIAAWLAHIPRGVLPTVPRWLWIVIALGAVTGSLGGGSPYVALGPVELGLGGALNFLKVAAVAVVLLGLCGMVSWTTNVADVAPAVATLGRPLRMIRIPVDDYAVAIALALRAFPMLIDEFRVLYAAWKLRPRPTPAPTWRARRQQRLREVIDLVASAITVTLRRGDEMGDAITARGGTGQISAAPSRPKLADWAALSIVTAVCAVAVALELTVLAPNS